MDTATMRREYESVVERHGPWTAHNVHLGNGLFTMSPNPTGDEVKLRRIVQIISDVRRGVIAGARILDLACLEGMYSLELAQRGAEVVAIEGREANLEKARFAARVLSLSVDFRLGDVRALSREEHGEFDVVLCLGILYHLGTPDVFDLGSRIAAVCRGVLVIDTSVAAVGRERREYAGHVYRGLSLFEHDATSTAEERLKSALELAGQPDRLGADPLITPLAARPYRLYERLRMLDSSGTREADNANHAARAQGRASDAAHCADPRGRWRDRARAASGRCTAPRHTPVVCRSPSRATASARGHQACAGSRDAPSLGAPIVIRFRCGPVPRSRRDRRSSH